MKNIYIHSIIFIMLVFSTSIKGSVSYDWMDETYSHFSNSDTISSFLTRMSASIGIPVIISEEITGSLNGKINKSKVSNILEILSQVYSIQWYYDGATIYFYHHKEIDLSLIDFEDTNPIDVKQQLIDSGIWDERFKWDPVDGYNAVYVSGPIRLKELIEELIEIVSEKKHIAISKNKNMEEKIAEVVPLTYVKAADHKIESNGRIIDVPGLVTTLRDLVHEQDTIKNNNNEKSDEKDDEKINPFHFDSISKDKKNKSKKKNKPHIRNKTKGTIRAHSSMNAIILFDTPSNIEKYKKLIKQLDVASAQIEIDVTIIDVVTDKINQLGLDWSVFTNSGILDLSEGLSASISGISGGPDFPGSIDAFRLNLNALAKDGYANILSQPSVITLDNITATIDNSETFYVKLTGVETVSLEEITSGSILQVTPRLINDKRIHLNIYLEDGNRTGAIVDGLPVVKKTKIRTQSVVNSEGSLLIGGYYLESSESVNVGVPFVKDIPYIGRMFKNTAKNKISLARLFLLTPRIIKDNDENVYHKSDTSEYLKTKKMNVLKNNDGVNINKDLYRHEIYD